MVPLFCSLMPKVKILKFWSEIVKRLFGATHVFGRNFTFCNLVFIGGALNLQQRKLPPPFFRLNAVNTAIFSVKRR